MSTTTKARIEDIEFLTGHYVKLVGSIIRAYLPRRES